MKYKPVYHDTSFYGPMGLPIGLLVDLRWKFDIRCQFFFLTSEIRDNWLAYSEKIYIWNIEFPNSHQLFPAKLYHVKLQCETAFEPKSMASIST